MQAAFRTLRDNFLAGLPQRWAEIESAPSSAAQQQALHRLVGAAGSYGFAALAAAARAAEQAASAQPGAPMAPLAQLRQLVQSHTDTVR